MRQNPYRKTASLLAIAWMSLIFFLSQQSQLPLPELEWVPSDKVAHLLAYGLLGIFYLVSFSKSLVTISWRFVLLASLCALAYGVSDEFHQSFIPGRDSSIADLAADFMGALLFTALGKWFLVHLTKKKYSSL